MHRHSQFDRFQCIQYDRSTNTIVCGGTTREHRHCQSLFTAWTKCRQHLSKWDDSWCLPTAIGSNQRRCAYDGIIAAKASITFTLSGIETKQGSKQQPTPINDEIFSRLFFFIHLLSARVWKISIKYCDWFVMDVHWSTFLSGESIGSVQE